MLIIWCFGSGRHGPNTRQLLFGAFCSILVQSLRTMELGDEDRVRLSADRCIAQMRFA